jgi:hypothetical protein
MIIMHRAFTIDDVRPFVGEAWGTLGLKIVERWAMFNADYFDGALKPIPLVITNAQPFGKRWAFCSPGGIYGRSITLNIPTVNEILRADNNILLHEMIHQFLVERDENPAHDGEPWRREIMRLTRAIKGVDIWAGPSKTVRLAGKVVRMNIAHPDSRKPSLTQKQIAMWPRDMGIDFGRLGT